MDIEFIKMIKESHKLFPYGAILGYEEKTDGVLVLDQGGFILKKEEMESLVYLLQNTINNYEKISLEVEKHNNKRLEDIAISNNQELPIYTHRKEKGYVYFITYDNLHYKIGKAKKLTDRIKQLNIKMPAELELIHSINTNDYTLTETLFHEYFKSKNTNGEWFKLSKKDIEYIKSNHYTKEIMNSIGGAVR